MRSLSSSMSSLGRLQGGRTADGRRKLAVDLRPGLRRRALGEAVEHFLKTFRRQILVGVAPDQHHRRVDAGAEALDFLPGEIAVGGELKRLLVDAPATELYQLVR